MLTTLSLSVRVKLFYHIISFTSLWQSDVAWNWQCTRTPAITNRSRVRVCSRFSTKFFGTGNKTRRQAVARI